MPLGTHPLHGSAKCKLSIASFEATSSLTSIQSSDIFKSGKHSNLFNFQYNLFVVSFQVKSVKPDVLLGLSGVGGLFTQQVCILNSSEFMNVHPLAR